MSAVSVKGMLAAATPGFLKPFWRRIETSPLGYRLVKGALWSLLGAAISRGLGLAASILVARMLGKEVFGQLGIVQSTVGMFGTFAGFGLGLTATKYVAEFRENDPLRASRVLSLSAIVAWVTGLLVTGILVTLAPWLAAKTLAAPNLAGEIQVGALLVLFGAVNGAQIGVLAGFEAFKRIAQVNFWTGLANFPCVTLGCWFFGLVGAVWGLVIAQAFGCILNRWALVQEARRFNVPVWSSDWRTELPVLWRFSMPATLASSMVLPVYWACQAMLVNQHGYGSMAEYSVGAQWRTLVFFVPSLLATSYLPICSSISAHDVEKRKRLMFANAGMLVVAGTLVAGTLFALAPWLLPLYGAAFRSGTLVLRLLLLVAVIDAAAITFTNTILATGRAWLRLCSNFVWATVVVLLARAWMPGHAAVGLALAVVTAQIVHLTLQIGLAMSCVNRRVTPPVA